MPQDDLQDPITVDTFVRIKTALHEIEKESPGKANNCLTMALMLTTLPFTSALDEASN